ncbi:leukotoxin LktA family filamentous adhesin, partial [uncultured Anaerovibrio sp.]|uniref:leukotoxin LktA family filamentous adhesin n=1 Tax=uncultured Anaerovibrio sp. TaxID=361586 RepID=UPI0025FA5717
MAYGYSSKKLSNKKSLAKTRQMEPRLLLASLVMAAGVFAYPLDLGEAAIVREDGTVLDASGLVHNIDPENVVSNDFAYNRFKEFDLNQGHIANLSFGGASTLANLVNKQININGIVNAVINGNNGNIDGHLIFLSPDGIAVGASGVINAGQFTGLVPTRTAFDTLYNTPANITLAAVDALNTGSFATGKKVEVSGKINTHSGVMLGAGIINLQDGAVLQSTKSLDFTQLVNIKNGDTIQTNADLGGLTAVEGSGGDIILMAKQESAVKDTKIEKDANNQDKEVANAIRWKDRSTDLDAKVSIGKGVSISTYGAVKLTAESTSTYEDSTPMTLTDTLKGIILGDDNKLINGLVDKLAKKEAGANKYLFVNYSSKKNKASVKIGENATITGQNIDIAATSKVELKQSIAVSLGQGKKDSEGKTIDDSSKAIAAVAVSRVYNNADVVIDGNLTANGADGDGNGIKVSANADTTAALSATGTGGEANAVAVGVAVLTGDTKSKVTVNNPTATALTAAQGKVTMDAVTGSDIDVNVGAVGKKSYVVSNVGLANYDTSADVSINRSITAGAVEVKAENNITGLKITVNNAVKDEESKGKDTAQASDGEKEEDNNAAAAEESKPDSEKSEDEKKSEQKSKDTTQVMKDASADANDEKTQDAAGSDGKGGVKDVKDKVEGTNEGGGNEKKTSAFGLGASVGILSNKNDANVTIGKNAVITATKPEQGDTPDGAVNLSAKTLMTASGEKEDSLKLTVKNAQANSAKVEIGAAVLVSNVKNNANIVLDSDGDKSAQIKGSAVSLDAAAGMGKYQKNNKDTDSVLSYEVSSESQADKETPATVVLDGSVGINTLKNNAIVLLGQQTSIDGSAVSLSADADTNAKGTYGATEANNKVGVGATVGLQNISGNSLIMAGKGVTLNGTESVSAAASTALDGTNEVKNAGKGESIGVSGMVALSYGDSNSIVSLDDEISTTAPAVMLTATNSTNVDNSARSESTGVTGSKAFGIGVGIVNYDVNSLAMISDNGSGISAPSGSTMDAEKAAQKVYQDAALARTVAGDTFAGKLGTATTGNATGSITTGSYTAAAITTGMLKNDAKAKASTSGSEDTSGNENKDSEKWTKWSKKGDEGAKEAKNNTDALENDTVTAQNESAAPTVTENTGEGQDPKVTNQKNNATGAGKEAASAANPEPDNDKKDEGAAPAAGSSESAGASIGMEGSVALTFLGGRTDAVLNNVTVQNGDDAVGSVALSATDFLGSITLGGTDIKHSLKDGSSSTKVAIGGTFAMNSSNRDVDSILRNSNLQKVESVSNTASKTGIEVAAGMGVSVSKGDGTNVAGAGVVYYNKANQDIHALLVNNTVTSSANGGQIDNKATSTDFQIAGALAANLASGSNTNVGFGGAVAISNLENNLSSGIIGGSYQDKFQAVNVEAQKGTTQISGAVAGGKSGYGFNGAFAYGSVKNTTSAYISGATVQGNTNSAVNVKAGEIPVLKADDERNSEKQQIENNDKLDNQTKSVLKDAVDADKNNKKTLEDVGVDTTGKVYLENGEEKSALDDAAKTTDEGKIADDAAKDESDAKDELGKNHSLTITAAMAGGLESDAGFGAGIAYNYVKNDIGANITNSTITAETVSGEAATDATIVSVGAGVAIGGKTFNGAGSGSWNDLKNDTKVTFANNTITGKNISEQAQNTSSIINIAGEVAGGKGMAVGLSLAYNSLNNTTGTYLKDNIIHLNGGENSVKLASTNQSKALAVAGAVNVNIKQSVVGATGTVAINRGVNNTESVLGGRTTGEKTELKNVKELSVTAEELSKKTTVAGGVSVGGKKVGFGAAVAYTSVGTDEKKESLLAEINHVNITTTNNGKVEVSVKDSKQNNNELEKSRVITVGSGLGVQWGKNWFTLQGAAAVSDIYKTSRAALNNSNINQGV